MLQRTKPVALQANVWHAGLRRSGLTVCSVPSETRRGNRRAEKLTRPRFKGRSVSKSTTDYVALWAVPRTCHHIALSCIVSTSRIGVEV